MFGKVLGRVRGLSVPNMAEGHSTADQINTTEIGDLIIAQSLPPRAELVRLGNSWQIRDASNTIIAAEPTTAALYSITNGEPLGGRIYVIDSVSVTLSANPTGSAAFSIYGQIANGPNGQTGALLGAGTIASLSGRRAYDGFGRLATDTPVASPWVLLGRNINEITVGGAWANIDVDVLGLYILPPRASYHLTVVNAAGGTNCHITIRWHELRLSCLS